MSEQNQDPKNLQGPPQPVATNRPASMKPMFLPEVEANPAPGAFRNLILAAQKNGQEYPQIWHMFAFKQEATNHLANFTQGMMRGEGPLSSGIRELIAAYTSYENHCPF